MSESKIFKLVEGVDCDSVGRAVESFLRDRKRLYTEGIRTPEGYFVQAKEATTWKSIAGMDASVQVRIIPTADMVVVEAGTGKWVEKAGIAAAGVVFFAPLAVTAAMGAWSQKKLPQEIFAFVEQFILSGGKNVNISMSMHQGMPDNQVVCPSCKAINQKDQKFCIACGSKLGSECPKCHTSVPFGVKFCPECGNSLDIVKTCAVCGNTLEPCAKFCANCGSPVNSEAPALEMKCTKCGETLSPSAKFCPGCGSIVARD